MLVTLPRIVKMMIQQFDHLRKREFSRRIHFSASMEYFPPTSEAPSSSCSYSPGVFNLIATSLLSGGSFFGLLETSKIWKPTSNLSLF